MKQLSFRKMKELYNLVDKYLPSEEEGLEILSYVGTIIKEMQRINPKAFIQALELMTGVDAETLLSEDGKVLYQLFLEGLTVNRMPEFQQFMRGK
jgi:hypothetical protein